MTSEAQIEPAARQVRVSDAGLRSIVRVLLHIVWTRLFLWGIVDYAVHAKHPRLQPQALHDFGMSDLSAVLRWDAWWYASVVDDGYRFDAHHASNVAFLPGFPAFIALVTPVFGSAALAGVLVANAAFIAAVLVFWSWVRERAGVTAAERAALFLIFYPFSFFFDTGYAESIYFLWCVLALREMDRDRPLAGAFYASLATLTRPMGLFLVPAFVLGLVRSRRAGKRLRIVELLPVVVPLLGLGAFASYLWVTEGSPFALWTAQRVGWGVGENVNLLRLPGHRELFRQLADAFHVLVPIPLFWLSLRAFRRLGPVPGVYALLTTCVAVFLGGDSVGREALAVVPVFAVLGMAKLGARTATALQALSFVLLGVFTYAFALGHFMG